VADECPHGAVVGACHLCRGDRPQTPPRPSAIFVARFASACSGCDWEIHAGQAVRYVNDRLHHAGCAP
jgi:hypothetical protein